MAPNAMNIATRMFNTPHLICPEKAAVIAQAFGPRLLGGDALELVGAPQAEARDREQPRPGATIIGDDLYRSVKKRGGYLNYQGVAVISVTGTLVRRGSYVGESSGLTSYEGLSAQIRAAAEDPEVRAIALEIDSFGGEAAGVWGLCGEIRAAREQKPVHAFLAEYALSAGYAIAAQADRITVPPFGLAGSIGVVTMHVDMSAQLKQQGVKVTLIHSGEHKVEGNPFQALPEPVRARIEAECDALRVTFAEHVEAGRRGRVSMADALATEAATFLGPKAVQAGLADEVSEARPAFMKLVEQLNPPAAVAVMPAAASPSLSQAMAQVGKIVTPADSQADVLAADQAEAMTFRSLEDLSRLSHAAQAALRSFQYRQYPAAEAEGSDCSSGCATGAERPSTKEKEMSKETLTQPDAEEQKAPPAAEQDTKAAAEAARQAERTRASKITAKVQQAGLPATLATELIDSDKSLEQAYDVILDKKAEAANDGGEIRNQVGAAVVTGDVVDRSMKGIEASLLAKVGLEGGERNEFSSFSLSEIARHTLTMRNLTFTGGRMEMVAAAFQPSLAGGYHGTTDFGNILENVANKSMLKGWMEAEESFPMFTSRGTLTDFKATSRVQIDAFDTLTEVPEDAEFTYGTMGDHKETVMLATYGKRFGLTRQAIINDDLDAFSKVPQRMGRSAKRTVGNLVLAVLTGSHVMSDSVELFHADHGNLAGSGGAPSEATFNAAYNAMATQTDRSGKATLNIRPAYVISGYANRSAILQTLNSEHAPDDTAKSGTTKQGRAANTAYKMVEPIFDARITGNAWFMSANPSMHDAIEVSYLDGVDTPFLDQQDGWDRDGTEWKVRIDAVAKALAYQTLYKNAGA